MAAPQDPRSLAQRVRRLEFLFFSLLLTLDDEGDDEDLWFEFRHFFRRSRDRDFFDDPGFDFFLNRMAERGQRSRPESPFSQESRSQLAQLQREVQTLKATTESLQIETHSLLVIQALGLPSELVRSTRFVPVRAYIDETPEGAINAISNAISEVLIAYGFTVADEFPEIKGSWFKKWFAKSKDVLSQPEVIERLEKIERAVELKAIDKPQADVDEKQAGAIAKLIKALEKVPNAAVQAGSVLVVKLITPKGAVIQARTLSQEEMVELENNQLLLQDPSDVLCKLTAACNSTRKTPPPKPLAGGGK
ncbi:hypothetical protein R75465_05624 [Paraburkholderia aspalathi]|uniref:hypothetical protein n=1 Tax=Paraburkholderia aspalathi TaxID=1324617 RepID=UPI001B1DE068|nr:hypothetical protein [Paraburkholderia aspalathi]CAE6816252.1 hypothetical protein R75465_05624 [Paraburkholderia aspalathi]